jgi:hypothetical protein
MTAIEVFRGNWSVPIGATFTQTVFEDERYRISYVVGTQAGMRGEWSLGNAFMARLDLRGPIPHGRISLDWYPVDGVSLSLGLDLVRMQVHAEWMYEDESPF